MARNLSNVSPQTTIVGAINSTVTAISVADDPVVLSDFAMVLTPSTDKANEEIVLVTNVVFNSPNYDLTVVRGQFGSTAYSHSGGAIAQAVVIKEDFDDLVEESIAAATGKTTPVDADEVGVTDSAASGVLKSLTWANLKATIKTYFDTLYGNVSNTGTPANNELAVWTNSTTVEGDTNLAWDGSTMTVKGIGLVLEKSNAQSQFRFQVSGNNAWESGVFNAERSRGTRASPTVVNNGTQIFSINASGYDGSAYNQAANLNIIATGTWTGSSRPAKMVFNTHGADGNSNTSLAMTIDQDQFVLLEESLFMAERASAGADAVAYGQIWVKNDVPNTLWFTNDAGTDFQLGVGGGGATTLTAGTVTATTYGITSDGSADDIVLPEATTSAAGLLGAAKWDEIVANSLKATNVSTNLSFSRDATTVTVESSDGNNVILPEADTTNAGILGSDKWDQIVANNAKNTNVSTNLSLGTVTATTVDVNSSDGTNATLVEANTTQAGLLGAAKWDEIVANSLKTSNIKAIHRPTWWFPSPTAAVDGAAFYTDVAITISQVNFAKGASGTNAVVQLYHNTNRGAAGTAIMTSSETVTSTSGQEQTGFADATIPADSWVWCEIISVSGAPEFISVTAKFTDD